MQSKPDNNITQLRHSFSCILTSRDNLTMLQTRTSHSRPLPASKRLQMTVYISAVTTTKRFVNTNNATNDDTSPSQQKQTTVWKAAAAL